MELLLTQGLPPGDANELFSLFFLRRKVFFLFVERHECGGDDTCCRAGGRRYLAGLVCSPAPPLSLPYHICMQAAEAQEGGLKIARTAAVGRTRGGNLTFFRK